MFVWYRHSALTYRMFDLCQSLEHWQRVSGSGEDGRLENFWLAPKAVRFYQTDWTLYLGDRSSNHKRSPAITQELGASTGIHSRSLVALRPGMRGSREKLQWASTRITTLQEDIAYSLFGIFGINLPVIYGEKKHNALGRLLQEIIA
ncbi:hypothetical protein DFH29DRAFT_949713 [Suillus ampliporus]|nr:hypothetical protein DFH29DRAFT_949713 [Suillus ampliporus]